MWLRAFKGELKPWPNTTKWRVRRRNLGKVGLLARQAGAEQLTWTISLAATLAFHPLNFLFIFTGNRVELLAYRKWQQSACKAVTVIRSLA